MSQKKEAGNREKSVERRQADKVLVDYENWLLKEEQKKRDAKHKLRNTMVKEMIK